MKRLDYLLIIIYISISLFFGWYFSNGNTVGRSDIAVLEIFSNNNLYATYDLPVKEPIKLRIDSQYGHNVVIVEDSGASMLESDCKDQGCGKEGTISKPGQMVVCLPNRLVVQIVGIKKDDNVDAVSY